MCLVLFEEFRGKGIQMKWANLVVVFNTEGDACVHPAIKGFSEVTLVETKLFYDLGLTECSVTQVVCFALLLATYEAREMLRGKLSTRENRKNAFQVCVGKIHTVDKPVQKNSLSG
jgi:hypothetical protein